MDAAVNGGIQNYKKAFLSEKFLEEHGEFEDLVQGYFKNIWKFYMLFVNKELRKVIQDHFSICQYSLEIYGESCDEQMKPLFEYLKGFICFFIMFF